MPGVTTELIDRLIDDLSKPEAFAESAQAVTRAAVFAKTVSIIGDEPTFTRPLAGTAVPLVGRGFQ